MEGVLILILECKHGHIQTGNEATSCSSFVFEHFPRLFAAE